MRVMLCKMMQDGKYGGRGDGVCQVVDVGPDITQWPCGYFPPLLHLKNYISKKFVKNPNCSDNIQSSNSALDVLMTFSNSASTSADSTCTCIILRVARAYAKN